MQTNFILIFNYCLFRIEKKLEKVTVQPKMNEIVNESSESFDIIKDLNRVLQTDEMTSNYDFGSDAGITKKKQQYMEQKIEDKTGTYDYELDPVMYKKARKRQQNRESAVRSRNKKKDEAKFLSEEIAKLNNKYASIHAENESLKKFNVIYEKMYTKQ